MGKEVHVIPIGQFSKMTRLSINALRLYDENGLLPPAHVDDSSGYRYYELNQANRAEAIRILRSVDMPLDEIATVLDAEDRMRARKQLMVHRERLAKKLVEQERMLQYLELLIEGEAPIMPYEIEVTELEPQLIATTTMETTLARIGSDIATGFGRLMQAMTREEAPPAGPPMILYHSLIDQETDGTIEVAVPVSAAFAPDDHVQVRELEGGTVATTVHTGPYTELAPAYQAITGWVADHGHHIAGPTREIYLNDPQVVQPSDLLTRIEFPICND